MERAKKAIWSESGYKKLSQISKVLKIGIEMCSHIALVSMLKVDNFCSIKIATILFKRFTKFADHIRIIIIIQKLIIKLQIIMK